MNKNGDRKNNIRHGNGKMRNKKAQNKQKKGRNQKRPGSPPKIETDIGTVGQAGEAVVDGSGTGGPVDEAGLRTTNHAITAKEVKQQQQEEREQDKQKNELINKTNGTKWCENNSFKNEVDPPVKIMQGFGSRGSTTASIPESRVGTTGDSTDNCQLESEKTNKGVEKLTINDNKQSLDTRDSSATTTISGDGDIDAVANGIHKEGVPKSDSENGNENKQEEGKTDAAATTDYFSAHASTDAKEQVQSNSSTVKTYEPGSPPYSGARSLAFLHKGPRGFVRQQQLCTFPVHLDDDSVRMRVLEKCEQANKELHSPNGEGPNNKPSTEEAAIGPTDMTNNNAVRNGTLHKVGSDLSPTSTREAEDQQQPKDDGILRNKSGERIKSSLKLNRVQSMPSATKMVHFDSNLEHVRRFSYREKPTAVRRAQSPVTFQWGSSDEDENGSTSSDADDDDMSDNGYSSDEDDELETNNRGRSRRMQNGKEDEEEDDDDAYMSFFRRRTKKDRELLLPNFPASRPGRPNWQGVPGPVYVEKLELDKTGRTLLGYVCVQNLSYTKQVTIRYTCDNWNSVNESQAQYYPEKQGHCLGGYDRFMFKVPVSMLIGSSSSSGSASSTSSYLTNAYKTFKTHPKMSLCVRYSFPGGEFWDNNDSCNYDVIIRDVETPIAPVRSAGSAHHRRNRTYPGSSIDDIHDDILINIRKKHNTSNTSSSASRDRNGGGLASRYNFAASFRNDTSKNNGNRHTNTFNDNSNNYNGYHPSATYIPLAFGPTAGYQFPARYEGPLNQSNDEQKQRRSSDQPLFDGKTLNEYEHQPIILGFSTPDGGSLANSPAGSGSNSPTGSNLASIPYHDIINKYCFFRSQPTRATPPTTSPALGPQGSPSPRACSPSSTSSSSPGPEQQEKMWRPPVRV